MTGQSGASTSGPALPDGWSARLPDQDDVAELVALRLADRSPWTEERSVDEAAVESEVVGYASWTRRQLVAVDPEGRLRGWISVQDRAAGRTVVALWLDRGVADAEAVAMGLYAWADGEGRAIARLRGLERTRMDASPFAEDHVQRGWLEAAGYTRRRRWLHMSRPVDPTGSGSGCDVRAFAFGAGARPIADVSFIFRTECPAISRACPKHGNIQNACQALRRL